MTASALRHGNRAWFADRRTPDRRTPDRRLQVTWHDDERTTVFSIWHGDACTATFQLPVEDNARLIGHLADALSHAATAEPRLVDPPPRWWARLRNRMGRQSAEIIPFRRR